MPAEGPNVSNPAHLQLVDDGGEDGPKISFAVHSWRRIVRDALTDPRLDSLPCKKDLYLVALDFSALCDHRGYGAYSAKERTGRALSERPDASLCELVAISKHQVSKMLKLLIALGFLRMTQPAAMGRQAEYEVTLPHRGVADVGECLAVAASLGFKAAQSSDQRAARTAKARDQKKINKAHRVARTVVENTSAPVENDQSSVDNPVDNSGQGVVQTEPSGGCAHNPCEGSPDNTQEGCADNPPLPIGVFGNTGTTTSRLRTGGLGAEPGDAKNDDLPVAEQDDERPAITQAAIRRRDKERADERRGDAEPCPGRHGDGCPRNRPVSPKNDEGLCVRCYGMLLAHRDALRDAGAIDHGTPVASDGPTAPEGSDDGGTPA